MSEQPTQRASRARLKPTTDPAKAIEQLAPWKPVELAPEDVGAIQALARGDAEPHLQKRALQFVLDLSYNSGMHYFPGEDGRRDTDFALGRASVGKQLVNMIKMKLKIHGEQG